MGAKYCKDGANEFVEGVVCQESDLNENGMKVCDLDGGKVLVVKQDRRLYALGTKCSHYGAPLANGALGKGRVRCPWHGACFSLANGDIEDFPGLDSIPCYQVQVGPEGIKVRARKTDLEANKRMKDMAARDVKNSTTFVVVGGGAAGSCCVEALRQEGFTGRLVMLAAEPYLPYDRIKLSKALNSDPVKLQLRPENFYKEHGIEILRGTSALKVDTKAKLVELSNGDNLKYDSIFLATGAKSRQVTLPGFDLKNVFTLRTADDAKHIFQALKPTSNVVVFGSSFIGMEVAAFCLSKVATVTVVGRSAVPFAESLGEKVGSRIASLFTGKGVKLSMGTSIVRFEGTDFISQAVLDNGTKLPVDVCVVGLGSTFNTEFLTNSGIFLNKDGTVPVDNFLESNVKGVFAGGDIACAPVAAAGDIRSAIGHWQLAHYHGRIAAFNMMGKAKPLATVPFFWTVLFGTSFRYAGYGVGFNEVVVSGDLDALKFVAYYCVGERVAAVATVGSDPIAAQFAEMLASGKELMTADIKRDSTAWHKKHSL